MLVPSIEGLAAGDRQNPEGYLLGFQPADDCQQVAYRPGKPIELGANELVPFSDVIEGRLKLLAIGYRRHLHAEYFLAPGSVKVAFLRLQAGYLSQ